MDNKKIAVGVDIGTTTISGIVLDAGQKQVLQIYNVPNDSKITSENSWEFMQSPERIWEIVRELLDDILANYSVTSIGVTGQMHGILLISPDGEALSPLYTWQDMQASLGENSSCEQLENLTNTRVPAGYGLATLYHLIQKNMVPKKPYVTGTIMDFITMKLCGLSRPVMHITNAASWGLFSTSLNEFDADLLEKAGIAEAVLPLVTAQKKVIGDYQNIPVAVAIGDNQAAFMGSVTHPEISVLINVGTGSQVSVLSKELPKEESLLVEARPFDGKQLLYSGSCLCGGRSYALLEQFFRRFATKCGLENKPYFDVINSLAKEGLASGNIVNISTTFAGTRENPNLRGVISQIGEENFTPEAFAAGLLIGMTEELYQLYQKMPHDGITKLVASGNGVRKNPVLRQVIEEVFRMELTIPDHTEEAAFGAAMFGIEAR
ncbi:MAG: hypothetical protein J6A61_05000 [Clostridia bacterium]|nr:hypothetical protein [Clostridia bacterium]